MFLNAFAVRLVFLAPFEVTGFVGGGYRGAQRVPVIIGNSLGGMARGS